MYLLDTDVFTLFLRRPEQQPELVRRIVNTPPEDLWISSITVEEVVRGALNLIRRDQQAGKGTAGYRLLAALVRDLAAWRILSFDDAADAIYRTIPAAVRRAGSQDCRIAASAIVRGFTVVTRNQRHFSQIPGVKIEDWTLPERPE